VLVAIAAMITSARIDAAAKAQRRTRHRNRSGGSRARSPAESLNSPADYGPLHYDLFDT